MSKPLKVIAGAPDKPLTIEEIELQCYVLEDEQRVLSQRGLLQGIGVRRGGASSPDNGGAQIPRFAALKSVNPFLSKELTAVLQSPVEFQPPSGGRTAYGYPATVLVEICKAVLAARDAGALHPQQRRIAERCDMLLRGLATVGIIALVDEATGYQEVRTKRALATILEKFIADELQSWSRTFPLEFYVEIFRLKEWEADPSSSRPSVIGHYTNDIVYARIAPGVLAELRRRNPVLPETGRRRHKHHQWFTTDIGHPKLKEHLAAVVALMKSSDSWSDFKYRLQRAFPARDETLLLPFQFDDEASGKPA